MKTPLTNTIDRVLYYIRFLSYLSIFAAVIGLSPLLIPILKGQTITIEHVIYAIFAYIILDKTFSLLEKKLDRDFTRLISEKAERSVYYVGVRGDALADIRSKAKKIKYLKNTHFVSDADSRYSSKEYEVFRYACKDIVDNGGYVEDLYGADSDRISLPLHDQFSSEMRKISNRYNVIRSNIVIPFFNFLIIEYRDPVDYSIVYFGWGGHTNDPTGEVYMSDDQGLVRTFDRYFSSLKSSIEKKDKDLKKGSGAS